MDNMSGFGGCSNDFCLTWKLLTGACNLVTGSLNVLVRLEFSEENPSHAFDGGGSGHLLYAISSGHW